MQRCTECNEPFKWNQLYKSLWFAFRPVQCRNCGTVHKVASASRLLTVLLLLVPMIYLSIVMQNFGLREVILPITAVIALVSLVLPFLLKYEKVSDTIDTNYGNR
ncbi:TIGR04104 family putative zinc finger protein [Planomicrobium okeanokoites]|uniref:TIGR04104 family putative zinc finger protein n=1 Tax=Planomicrobium okeanokoites TaxID=244 RepID=UPI0030F71444